MAGVCTYLLLDSIFLLLHFLIGPSKRHLRIFLCLIFFGRDLALRADDGRKLEAGAFSECWDLQ